MTREAWLAVVLISVRNRSFMRAFATDEPQKVSSLTPGRHRKLGDSAPMQRVPRMGNGSTVDLETALDP